MDRGAVTYADVVRVGLRVSLLLMIALLAGCGGSRSGAARGSAAPGTRLTILAVNPNLGRAVFHLACEPAGGDLPSPARACGALRDTPSLVTNPKPFICHGGPNSWWDITISGRLRGHVFRSHISTCWTPQMAMIGQLGINRSLAAHLAPRRSQELIGGEQRTIPAGVLRPGDLVVCQTRGRRLEDGVPIEVGAHSQIGYSGVGITSVTLTVTRHRDGSVTASCT
jgi:hypothetical protein